jgi:hypothetical protein
MFFGLANGLFTKSKLSGLLFGSYVLSGLGVGLGLYWYCYTFRGLIHIGQVHTGIVIKDSLNMDTETAFVLKVACSPTGSDAEEDSEPVRVSIDYFPTTNTITRISTNTSLFVVGNRIPDQYGRQWLVPCDNSWSGIYSHCHPIGILYNWTK